MNMWCMSHPDILPVCCLAGGRVFGGRPKKRLRGPAVQHIFFRGSVLARDILVLDVGVAGRDFGAPSSPADGRRRVFFWGGKALFDGALDGLWIAPTPVL